MSRSGDIQLDLLKELKCEIAELLAKVCNPLSQIATVGANPTPMWKRHSGVDSGNCGWLGQDVWVLCLARQSSTLKIIITEHTDKHGKGEPSNHNIF